MKMAFDVCVVFDRVVNVPGFVCWLCAGWKIGRKMWKVRKCLGLMKRPMNYSAEKCITQTIDRTHAAIKLEWISNDLLPSTDMSVIVNSIDGLDFRGRVRVRVLFIWPTATRSCQFSFVMQFMIDLVVDPTETSSTKKSECDWDSTSLSLVQIQCDPIHSNYDLSPVVIVCIRKWRYFHFELCPFIGCQS